MIRYPSPLPRLSSTVADGRFVAEQLVVANGSGASHPCFGDQPRFVLDVRSPWDDGDAAEARWLDPEPSMPPAVAHLRLLPVNDHGPVPVETAQAAVDWYRDVREQRPDVLVVVNCLAGVQRSATIAYAILRRVYGLSHDEAFRRVATRAHRAAEERFSPSTSTLADVRTWCDTEEK